MNEYSFIRLILIFNVRNFLSSSVYDYEKTVFHRSNDFHLISNYFFALAYIGLFNSWKDTLIRERGMRQTKISHCSLSFSLWFPVCQCDWTSYQYILYETILVVNRLSIGSDNAIECWAEFFLPWWWKCSTWSFHLSLFWASSGVSMAIWQDSSQILINHNS